MSTPFNVRIMDVDAFVTDHAVAEVTTGMIREPSTQEFHPDGLFSEEIFGRLGTQDRLTTHGYIALRMKTITPILYNTIKRLGGFYPDLMAGRVYAIWDPKKADFDRVFGDPEDHPEANTGFSFFVKYFPQIKFKTTDSLSRESRIDLLNEYRAIGLQDKYLVHPAGLRDIQNDAGGRLVQDDLNKLYTTLLAYTRALPENATSPLYDGIKFNIQSKTVEIYEHLSDLTSGKRGFLQGHFASRRIALGTRNVITAANYVSRHPDDPQALKPDETIVGIYQAAKAFQPLFFYHLTSIFLKTVFGDESSGNTIPLIDRKSLQLTYVDIEDDEKQKWITSEGVNKLVNRFANTRIRDRPMTVKDVEGKTYYVHLVYDLGDRITLFRSIEDLKRSLPSVDMTRIRPLTWAECFYMATQFAVQDNYVFITRYPVLGDGSCYPSKVHLASTLPGRIVTLFDLEDPTRDGLSFAEYPVLGNAYQDTVVIDHGHLAGLGGDFDGDTISLIAVMSEEAKEIVRAYMSSTRSILDTQQRLVTGDITDTAALCLYNWTR